MFKRTLVDLFLVFTVLLTLGVSAASGAPPAAEVLAQEEMTYTVKLGDNLWALAEKYLGSGPDYWAIVDATNAKYGEDTSFAHIENPSLVHPGWKLLIPGTEQEPIPISEGAVIMSLQENKALVRRFVEEVQNQYNLDALDVLFSPDFVDHSGMSIPPNLDGTRQLFTMMFSAFPDLRVNIHDQVAEGDKVVTRKTFHGTHQGEFMGIPPTDKEVAFDVIDIFRIVDGKITDHWNVVDMLGLMQQLGVFPPPG